MYFGSKTLEELLVMLCLLSNCLNRPKFSNTEKQKMAASLFLAHAHPENKNKHTGLSEYQLAFICL